jgi:hypothetical protein
VASKWPEIENNLKLNVMEGVFVPLGFFAMVVAIVYLRQRKQERLVMMQKGIDARFFETAKHSMQSLKWGIVLVALGLGMLTAKVLSKTQYFFPRTEEAYFSMLFLFGGVSLLIFHFIDRRRHDQEKNELEG